MAEGDRPGTWLVCWALGARTTPWWTNKQLQSQGRLPASMPLLRSHSGGVHAVRMSVFLWLTYALTEGINSSAELRAESDLRYLSLPGQGSVKEFIKCRENRLNGSPACLSHPIWKHIYLRPIVIAAVRSQCQRKRIKGAGQKIQLAFQVGGGRNTLLRKCCRDNRKSARFWLDLLKYKFFPCVKDTTQQKCFQEKKNGICRKRLYDVWDLLQNNRRRLRGGAEIKLIANNNCHWVVEI